MRIAKVPTTVDNQAFGVLAALAAAGVDPASLDAIVHGTTTTTNAMLERKIATVGLITTKGFRDVLELGRRTRPTPYGLKGRFVPLIERRPPARGRRADGRRRARPRAARRGRGRGRGASADRARRARASSSTSCTATSTRRTRRAPPRSCARSGRTATSPRATPSSPSSASTSAARRRRSTPRSSRCCTATSSGCRASSPAAASRASCSSCRATAARCRPRIVAEHAVATVMSGPASGVIAAAATAMQAGSRAGRVRQRRHLRHGRHLERRRPRPRRHAVGVERPRARVRDADPRADGRRPHDRRRRRLDRLGRRRRGCCASARRARARRRGRSATAAAARGRRSPTPTSSSAGSTRSGCSPSSTRVSMDAIRAALARARRRAARPRRDRRGGGDRPRRQRQDGRRDPHGQPGARPRPARLRAVRVRRRRAAARGGAGAGAGDPEAADPGAAGPHQRARLRRRRPAPRLRRHRQPAARGARRRPRRRGVRGADRAAAGRCSRARTSPSSSVVTLHRADMQFQGQSHILPVAIDSTAITVAELRAAFTAAYWKRFGVELPEIRPVLVNLHTAVIGKRKAVSLEGDRGGEAGGDARRGEADDAAGLVRRRLARHAGLRARAAAGRCAIRRAGDHRAARLHDGGRAGESGRGRCDRQPDRHGMSATPRPAVDATGPPAGDRRSEVDRRRRLVTGRRASESSQLLGRELRNARRSRDVGG